MKTTVNFDQFRDAFRELRPNGFSFNGLEVLYDHLLNYEADTGTEIELDVIAICCDFTESTIDEALEYYNLDDVDELMDATTVIFVDDTRIIYRDF